MATTGTPWFRLYSQLRSHPKLEDLAATLKVSKAQAAGHLVLLWCWVTDYAEDGCLKGIDTTRIERAACWEGRSGHLARALVACRWLDGRSGAYSVHDWMDYAESYKRAKTKAKRRGVSPDSLVTVEGQSLASPPDRIGEDRKGEDGNDTRSSALSEAAPLPSPSPDEHEASVAEAQRVAKELGLLP